MNSIRKIVIGLFLAIVAVHFLPLRAEAAEIKTVTGAYTRYVESTSPNVSLPQIAPAYPQSVKAPADIDVILSGDSVLMNALQANGSSTVTIIEGDKAHVWVNGVFVLTYTVSSTTSNTAMAGGVQVRPLGSEARLSQLIVENGVASPSFASSTFNYDVRVTATTTKLPQISVKTADPRATFTQSYEIGTSTATATIQVYAENARSTTSYKVSFARESASSSVIAVSNVPAAVPNAMPQNIAPAKSSGTSAYRGASTHTVATSKSASSSATTSEASLSEGQLAAVGVLDGTNYLTALGWVLGISALFIMGYTGFQYGKGRRKNK